MRFNENDIDMLLFLDNLNEEIHKIQGGPSAKHYQTGLVRTYTEIREVTYDSKICEEMLVQLCNFTYSNKKWHDLVDPKGDLVEVKFIKSSIPREDMQRYLTGIHNKIKHYNHSRYIYGFQMIDSKYELIHILDTLK